ncbi:MAG TPA: PIN domain-containing protein [Pirellulales bacterium]|nr:PIN domain-containing protein [Pirellulales bacterium]
MASAAPAGYLLDTNILVHLIRGKAVGKAIEAHFGLHGGLNRSIICVVTVGEMYSLARKWNWGQSRLARLQHLLGEVVWVDINRPSVLDAYGELDDLSNRLGRPMGKNDVWIAAVAKLSRMTLLTTDGDFDHLHPGHLIRIRLDENTGNPVP